MSSSTTIITCIFCGLDGPTSGEDVIPTWLAKRLRLDTKTEDGTPEHSYFDDTYEWNEEVGALQLTKTQRIGNLPRPYKIPDVCESCNTGWMSRLELAAQRIMPGLIDGKPILIEPFDQFILATWGCKTALTFDAALTPRHVPDDVGTRSFYKRGYPLPLTFVTIGHDPYFQDDAPGLQIPHARHHQNWRSEPSGEIQGGTVRVAFQFRRLLIHVQLNYPETLPQSAVIPDLPYHQHIWPPTGGPVAWLKDLERDLPPPTATPEDPPADASIETP